MNMTILTSSFALIIFTSTRQSRQLFVDYLIFLYYTLTIGYHWDFGVVWMVLSVIIWYLFAVKWPQLRDEIEERYMVTYLPQQVYRNNEQIELLSRMT